MTKTQELEAVAWLCTRPTDHGPEESLSAHAITDGDRSLGWHDEPLVTEAAASAIIKGLEERIEALMRERASLIETKREQIADLVEQRNSYRDGYIRAGKQYATSIEAAEAERDALLAELEKLKTEIAK